MQTTRQNIQKKFIKNTTQYLQLTFIPKIFFFDNDGIPLSGASGIDFSGKLTTATAAAINNTNKKITTKVNIHRSIKKLIDLNFITKLIL